MPQCIMGSGERVYHFADLPPSPKTGDRAIINDSGTVAYNGAAAGGGAIMAKVWWNGAAWVYG
jgi:hypothetical protein